MKQWGQGTVTLACEELKNAVRGKKIALMMNTSAIDNQGRLLVDVNPEFYRPAEVEFLWGDSTKAEQTLGWKRDVDFKGLVAMMMDADLKEIAGMSCEEYKNSKAN